MNCLKLMVYFLMKILKINMIQKISQVIIIMIIILLNKFKNKNMLNNINKHKKIEEKDIMLMNLNDIQVDIQTNLLLLEEVL